MSQTSKSAKELMPWGDTDRVALREFLNKHPHFIPHLELAKPACEGDTLEKRALSGSEKEGAEKILQKLDTLAQDENTNNEEPGFIN